MKVIFLSVLLLFSYSPVVFSQCDPIPQNPNPTVKNLVDKQQGDIYEGREWGTVSSTGHFTVQLNNNSPELSDQITVFDISGVSLIRYYHAFRVHGTQSNALRPRVWYRSIITEGTTKCTTYVYPPEGSDIGNTEPDFIQKTNGKIYGATWNPSILNNIWKNSCFIVTSPPQEFIKLNIPINIIGPTSLQPKQSGAYSINFYGKNPSGFVNDITWEVRSTNDPNWTEISNNQTVNFTMPPGGVNYYLKVAVKSRDEIGTAQILIGQDLPKLNFDDNEDHVAINLLELLQNYPNPFNPTTEISYNIPKQSFVSLKVFNTLGKEVAELVNRNQEAGVYSVEFNGSNLPSGIYFYRITAGNFSETKKMILAK